MGKGSFVSEDGDVDGSPTRTQKAIERIGHARTFFTKQRLSKIVIGLLLANAAIVMLIFVCVPLWSLEEDSRCRFPHKARDSKVMLERAKKMDYLRLTDDSKCNGRLAQWALYFVSFGSFFLSVLGPLVWWKGKDVACWFYVKTTGTDFGSEYACETAKNTTFRIVLATNLSWAWMLVVGIVAMAKEDMEPSWGWFLLVFAAVLLCFASLANLYVPWAPDEDPMHDPERQAMAGDGVNSESGASGEDAPTGKSWLFGRQAQKKERDSQYTSTQSQRSDDSEKGTASLRADSSPRRKASDLSDDEEKTQANGCKQQ